MSTADRDVTTAKDIDTAFASFLKDYPTYRDTSAMDELREKEYSRLDAQGHIYLDFTGASLYAESQPARHLQLLKSNVFGNPHSLNPTSMAMTDLVERARNRVLRYFNASHNEYLAIFTPNASGALRLVGEAYPFDRERQVPPDVRQPQLGQRHPRVRADQERSDHLRAGPAAGDAR